MGIDERELDPVLPILKRAYAARDVSRPFLRLERLSPLVEKIVDVHPRHHLEAREGLVAQLGVPPSVLHRLRVSRNPVRTAILISGR